MEQLKATTAQVGLLVQVAREVTKDIRPHGEYMRQVAADQDPGECDHGSRRAALQQQREEQSWIELCQRRGAQQPTCPPRAPA